MLQQSSFEKEKFRRGMVERVASHVPVWYIAAVYYKDRRCISFIKKSYLIFNIWNPNILVF